MPGRVLPPAPRPCPACPYRRDVPAGVWAASEYAKLRTYDADIARQPQALFLCHQPGRSGAAPDRVCAGWVGCHRELLAVRMAPLNGSMTSEDTAATLRYASPVPLFTSGAEAADHGESAIDRPGPYADEARLKILARRPDVHLG